MLGDSDPTDSAPTGGDMLYRDAVHLDIPITPLAEAILDTPEFQRLGGINQLGFVELVYREATSRRLCPGRTGRTNRCEEPS